MKYLVAYGITKPAKAFLLQNIIAANWSIRSNMLMFEMRSVGKAVEKVAKGMEV